jgi:hypothetical protein
VRQSLPTHYLRKQTATAPTVLALDLSAVSLLADAVLEYLDRSLGCGEPRFTADEHRHPVILCNGLPL